MLLLLSFMSGVFLCSCLLDMRWGARWCASVRHRCKWSARTCGCALTRTQAGQPKLFYVLARIIGDCVMFGHDGTFWSLTRCRFDLDFHFTGDNCQCGGPEGYSRDLYWRLVHGITGGSGLLTIANRLPMPFYWLLTVLSSRQDPKDDKRFMICHNTALLLADY